jgi:hypothetical protein
VLNVTPALAPGASVASEATLAPPGAVRQDRCARSAGEQSPRKQGIASGHPTPLATIRTLLLGSHLDSVPNGGLFV